MVPDPRPDLDAYSRACACLLAFTVGGAVVIGVVYVVTAWWGLLHG